MAEVKQTPVVSQQPKALKGMPTMEEARAVTGSEEWTHDLFDCFAGEDNLCMHLHLHPPRIFLTDILHRLKNNFLPMLYLRKDYASIARAIYGHIRARQQRLSHVGWVSKYHSLYTLSDH